MDPVTSESSRNEPKLDTLPPEILVHIFSFVFEIYTPRLKIVSLTRTPLGPEMFSFKGWRAYGFPESAYFLISKSLHSAAQQARLDCFSGTFVHRLPFMLNPRSGLQPRSYLRLLSRLNQHFGSRIKRHVYRTQKVPWMPWIIQGVDTRYPVALDFQSNPVWDRDFWSCFRNVSVPVILDGGIDEKLEAWLATGEFLKYSDENAAGFTEYPWSQIPKNVEMYLTIPCICYVPSDDWPSEYPFDVVFIWRDAWRMHEIRFNPGDDLSPGDIERLIVDKADDS